ncbi:MAG: sugar nucleotide-binding protein [Spirochaetia bacterium]|nr:sugar nucleotide-binding protein [Spirochaetia bacterium]
MIWLIGSQGFIGKEISKKFDEKKYNWVGTNNEVDISNADSLESFAQSIKTAAYFPSELPKSERQIKWIVNCAQILDDKIADENPEFCEKINSKGAENIARLARKIGAKLIHISDVSVFDCKGNIAFSEENPKYPCSILGKTLLAGEIAIQKEMNQYYIFRTTNLFGQDNSPLEQFISSVLNNQVVQPVYGKDFALTYISDFCDTIIQFIEKSNNATELFGKHSAPSYGIYNVSNSGTVNNKELLKEIRHLCKKYYKITSNSELTDKALSFNLPENTLLNTNKVIKEINLKNPSWQKSLEKYFKTNKK